MNSKTDAISALLGKDDQLDCLNLSQQWVQGSNNNPTREGERVCYF